MVKTKVIIKKHVRDFRSLDENTQAELRRLAFLNLDKGRSLDFVAELVDVHIQTIRDWIKRRTGLVERKYKGEKRGRVNGDERLLNQKEETKIQSLIENKTPDKLGLGAALWTRRVIAKLIEKRTKVKLHLNTVGDYLQRWGLTPQRPGKVAYEQDEKIIKAWIKNTYSAIVLRASTENAEICFGDETGVSLNTYYGRSYAPKGQTPTIKLPAVKSHVSVISSISNLGLFKFMMYKGGLNNTLFLIFLEKLIKDSPKKIFLILDNLSVHKSKVVKEWVEKNKDKIELFFPPSLCSTMESNRTIPQHFKARTTLQILPKNS
jgi:transposase